MRGFVGHTESLGTTFTAIAAALSQEPALDPECWGSAFAADPWPRPLPAELPETTRARLRQHYQGQQPHGVRTLTFVTLVSHSLVSLEDHEGALVLAITYDADAAAAGATAVVTDLPQDVPADVRAAVGARAFTVATTLHTQLLASDPQRADDRVTLLLGLAALWHDDLRLAETLRQLAQRKPADWALRAAGIAVAQRAGYTLLLHELWAGETDPELHTELTTLLGDTPPQTEAGA